MKFWVSIAILLSTLTIEYPCTAQERILSGIEAQALSVAVMRFQADAKTHYLKPQLKNYDIWIERPKDKKLLIFHFGPHRDSNLRRRGGGNSYGPVVSYHVRIGDFKILKKQLYR